MFKLHCGFSLMIRLWHRQSLVSVTFFWGEGHKLWLKKNQFVCVVSSLLHRLFSSWSKWGLLSSCGAGASEQGGPFCHGAQDRGRTGFSNWHVGSAVASWALGYTLNSCGAQTCPLQHTGSSQVQGSNPCLLHWQADSLLLSHQGSPCFCDFCIFPIAIFGIVNWYKI